MIEYLQIWGRDSQEGRQTRSTCWHWVQDVGVGFEALAVDENCQPSSYPHVRRIDIGFEFGQVGVGFEEVGFKMSRFVLKHSVGFEMLALSYTCPYWLVSRCRRWLVSRRWRWVRDVGVEFEMLAVVSRGCCWGLRCWRCDQDVKVGLKTLIPGLRHRGWLTLVIPLSMAVAKKKRCDVDAPCELPIEFPGVISAPGPYPCIPSDI
jgi:hypothetical protein